MHNAIWLLFSLIRIFYKILDINNSNPFLPRGFRHNFKIWRVKSKRCCWETISDQVDPQELDWDQGLRQAQRSCQEDGDNFSNIGRDEIANELKVKKKNLNYNYKIQKFPLRQFLNLRGHNRKKSARKTNT